MNCKMIEVRDRATCVPMLAIKIAPEFDTTLDNQERWLMRRAGFSSGYDGILLVKFEGTEAHHDPYQWSNSRTYRTVHLWLRDNFNDVIPGQVVDVEFILGEVDKPKTSERGK